MNGVESTGKGDLLTSESKGKIILVYSKLLPLRIGIDPAILSNKDRVGTIFVFVQACLLYTSPSPQD